MNPNERGFLLLPLLVLLALSLLLIQISATSLSQAAQMQNAKLDGERLQKQASLIIQKIPLDNLPNPETTPNTCLPLAAPLFTRLNRQGCLKQRTLPASSDFFALLDLELQGTSGMRGHWQILLTQPPETAPARIHLIRDCLGPQRSDCQ